MSKNLSLTEKYAKLFISSEDIIKKAQLIQVIDTTYNELSDVFIEQDSRTLDAKNTKSLKTNGKCIILLFRKIYDEEDDSRIDLFSVVKRYTEQRSFSFHDKVGQIFKLVIEPKKHTNKDMFTTTEEDDLPQP